MAHPFKEKPLSRRFLLLFIPIHVLKVIAVHQPAFTGKAFKDISLSLRMLRNWLRSLLVIVLLFMLQDGAVASAQFKAASPANRQASIDYNRQPLCVYAGTGVTFSSLTDARLPLSSGHLPRVFPSNTLFAKAVPTVKRNYRALRILTHLQLLFPFHVFW